MSSTVIGFLRKKSLEDAELDDRKLGLCSSLYLAKSVEKEALVLFANSKAIIRADRLGVLDSLVNASKNKGVLVKIISPITEENAQIVEKICESSRYQDSQWWQISFGSNGSR